MNGLPTLPKKKVPQMDSLYNYSANLLNSDDVLEFSSLKHKIVLVQNIGMEDEKLSKEIEHLEKLVEKYGKDGLVILVFLCNQFTQEPVTESEMERRLKELRNPDASSNTMVIFSPINVNGSDAHPLFQFLTRTIPMPADNPLSFSTSPEKITWQPVLRSDIAGDSEKFLILPNGRPYKRYSTNCLTTNVGYDVKEMVSTLKNARRNEPSGTKYILT